MVAHYWSTDIQLQWLTMLVLYTGDKNMWSPKTVDWVRDWFVAVFQLAGYEDFFQRICFVTHLHMIDDGSRSWWIRRHLLMIQQSSSMHYHHRKKSKNSMIIHNKKELAPLLNVEQPKVSSKHQHTRLSKSEHIQTFIQNSTNHLKNFLEPQSANILNNPDVLSSRHVAASLAMDFHDYWQSVDAIPSLAMFGS